ncbi:dihydropteroate synthase [Candidatus Methanomassiliicoccus intestinalis]|uniref:dihydropteroate synthase n=1 Tax=Candidatus Methanomassiliicoccus intestinalis TaxID=1406512 RepID=UPI0037DCA2D6
MGILNVTPDSFSDGGKNSTLDLALAAAERMIEDGVDIIDIGGESTRPGALAVSLEEELARVIPPIKELSASFEIPLSVDTRKADVARAALAAGATIINDVSGFSDEMLMLLAESGAPAVLMHSLWDPQVMQEKVQESTYHDVITDILQWTQQRITHAEELGVNKSQLILDPGIGFGKLAQHNLEIIRRGAELKAAGLPLLIGASRKNFIGEITYQAPADRLGGSLGVAAYVQTYADIVRVHDVRETVDLLSVIKAIENS